MKITIVRHGISESNIKEKGSNPYFCGAYNTPLADSGREMAKRLKNNEDIKRVEKVYSSDLDRAIETAKLAIPNKKINIDKNLRERSLGIFENHSEKEIREEYPEYFPNGKALFRHDFVKKAPGGENYTDVCNRCLNFLKTLNLESDENIGIFSHMHFIRCFVYILTGMTEEELLSFIIPNCEPIVLEGTKIGDFKFVSHKKEEFLKTKKHKDLIKR